MFNRLYRLYKSGALSEVGISNAVAKGWITEDEAAKILEKE